MNILVATQSTIAANGTSSADSKMIDTTLFTVAFIILENLLDIKGPYQYRVTQT